MIYIINTNDPEKKKYLEDFLADNELEYLSKDKPSRIQKINVAAKVDYDFETLTPAEIGLGLLNVSLEAKADLQFVFKLMALVEQETGTEIN